MSANLEEAIQRKVRNLPDEQQKEVLEFVEGLEQNTHRAEVSRFSISAGDGKKKPVDLREHGIGPSKPGIYAPALLPLRTGTIQRWISTTTTIRILPPSTKTCKRTDVALVLFPNSDLGTAKLRPALVAQADNLNTGLPQVVRIT